MAAEMIGSVELADLLRCTPAQLEELARAGEIPGLKFGRSWVFMRADLLAYLAEKARAEAKERRARRQPGAPAVIVKSRRRAAPPLPRPAPP